MGQTGLYKKLWFLMQRIRLQLQFTKAGRMHPIALTFRRRIHLLLGEVHPAI